MEGIEAGEGRSRKSLRNLRAFVTFAARIVGKWPSKIHARRVRGIGRTLWTRVRGIGKELWTRIST